jgi:hypothetical protein
VRAEPPARRERRTPRFASRPSQSPGKRIGGTVVACPSGKRALGGGVVFGSPNAAAGDQVMQDGPVNATTPGHYNVLANGAVPDGWVGFVTNGAENARTLRVYVICA